MGRGFNESGKKSAGLSSTTLSTDRLEADRLECPQPSRTSRQNGMRRPAEREEGHVLFHRVPFPSDATFSRTKKKPVRWSSRLLDPIGQTLFLESKERVFVCEDRSKGLEAAIVVQSCPIGGEAVMPTSRFFFPRTSFDIVRPSRFVSSRGCRRV